jgi:hypothetical protein
LIFAFEPDEAQRSSEAASRAVEWRTGIFLIDTGTLQQSGKQKYRTGAGKYQSIISSYRQMTPRPSPQQKMEFSLLRRYPLPEVRCVLCNKFTNVVHGLAKQAIKDNQHNTKKCQLLRR